MKTVLKLLTALAAIAGVVYVVATYGDKIVAWCKKMLSGCPCCNDCECQCETEEAPVEEVPAEETVAEEVPVVEVPVEEVVVEENEPVAEESDFEA